MKKVFRKSVNIGVVLALFTAVVSCEKDFTDIGSNIISNTEFDTGAILVDITAKNSPVEKVLTDNITQEPGQYLLGVYASTDYEKLEASIVSQISINTSLKTIETDTLTKYQTNETSISYSIDTVFIKLPYQSTLESTNSDGPIYSLDSIIGNESNAFNLNVYQSDTYLSSLDPMDPSKLNKYFSDFDFQKKGTELNSTINHQFKPNYKTISSERVYTDTVIYIKRRTSNNLLITTDTVKYVTSSSATTPIVFARVPLDEDKFKELFLDKYESSEFSSQDAFNDYFRGVILEAKGDDGALISFNFNSTIAALNPSIEVYYTNTVLNKSTGDTIKTFRKNNSFPLSGIRANTFKMENKVYPVNEEVKVQGTAGSEVSIDLFGADADNNGIADKIEELRSKNWLINDASLTFYINPSADTLSAPYRLYLYKTDENATNPNLSQIKDSYREQISFGGALERDEDGKPEKYTFKITDYISDLLRGETNYSPTLKLKVFNNGDYPSSLPSPTPLSVNDTIFKNYSWNPRAITLFNHSSSNGTEKAQLKISYSEKK